MLSVTQGIFAQAIGSKTCMFQTYSVSKQSMGRIYFINNLVTKKMYSEIRPPSSENRLCKDVSRLVCLNVVAFKLSIIDLRVVLFYMELILN